MSTKKKAIIEVAISYDCTHNDPYEFENIVRHIDDIVRNSWFNYRSRRRNRHQYDDHVITETKIIAQKTTELPPTGVATGRRREEEIEEDEFQFQPLHERIEFGADTPSWQPLNVRTWHFEPGTTVTNFELGTPVTEEEIAEQNRTLQEAVAGFEALLNPLNIPITPTPRRDVHGRFVSNVQTDAEIEAAEIEAEVDRMLGDLNEE